MSSDDRTPPLPALLRLLADALLADGLTPDDLAASVGGEAVSDGDGYVLSAPGLPPAPARLRLSPGGATLTVTSDPTAPLTLAALEAVFGPGREGIPMPIERFGASPGMVGVRAHVDFDVSGPAGRSAFMDAVILRTGTHPEPQVVEVTISAHGPAAQATPARPKGLLGWLRR